MKVIDARGLSCPEPVIMTKNALASEDAAYEVLVDNVTAKENVTRFANHQGYQVAAEEKRGRFPPSYKEMTSYIATFYSHFGAIRFKKACEKTGLPASVMPVPRNLSSSCGTCVRFQAAKEDDFPEKTRRWNKL